MHAQIHYVFDQIHRCSHSDGILKAKQEYQKFVRYSTQQKYLPELVSVNLQQ